MAKQSGIPLNTLKTHLDKGRILPVYLVAGAEPFLADEAVRLIAEAVAARGGEFARSSYHGDEVDLAAVLDDVRTVGLFSPARLVVVAPADRFLDVNKTDRWAALAAYAGKPASKACLVFVMEKADGRKKLTKMVEETGGLIACNRVYDREIPGWIQGRVKGLGRQIHAAAAQLLAEFLGTDLGTLASEIEKLVVYLGGRDKITADDVEAVSLRDRGRTIFELTDAIGGKNPAKVLAVVNRLIEQGERTSAILFVVSKHIRKLWGAKELIQKGVSREAAARQVGQNYYLDEFLGQVDAFSVRDLRRCCSRLLRCEATLKRSSIDEQLLLETTFLRLVTSPQRAAV